MNIKDYLHLYLGCELVSNATGDTVGVLEGIVGNEAHFRVSGVWYSSGIEHYKPILRPLSDITEDECEFFYSWYFDRRYAEDWSTDTGSANYRPKRVKPTIEHVQRIISGADYRSDSFMRVVELTKWLLDLHFDPFGLIDAGLAIDKTHLVRTV